MVVPVDLVVPDVCPVCGLEFSWGNHCNAVDLCGLYFVTCSRRRVDFTCRWCLLLVFEGYPKKR